MKSFAAGKGEIPVSLWKYLEDFLYSVALDSRIEMLNSKHGKCREGIPKRTDARSWFCKRQFNSSAHLAQQKKAARKYDYSRKIYLQSEYHRGRRDSTNPVVCKLRAEKWAADFQRAEKSVGEQPPSGVRDRHTSPRAPAPLGTDSAPLARSQFAVSPAGSMVSTGF